MVKLAISGYRGKMGSRIIALAKEDKGLKVVVELEINDDPNEIASADCLIEFTNPQATMQNLDAALRHKKAMVIGTTGLSQEQIEKIKEASKSIPILFSPNMSLGVNLLFKLVEIVSAKLPSSYRVNITEAHHIHKKDAPSGTAKNIAQIIKKASGIEVKDIKSIREGEIIGDHTVVFESPFEKIEISHSAKTRDIFALGALEAAKFIVKQKQGLFDIQDLLKATN